MNDGCQECDGRGVIYWRARPLANDPADLEDSPCGQCHGTGENLDKPKPASPRPSEGVREHPDNRPDEHATLRLLMFEVWEADSPDFPLFVTSDGHEARSEMHEGDTLVKRYWVREGSAVRAVAAPTKGESDE